MVDCDESGLSAEQSSTIDSNAFHVANTRVNFGIYVHIKTAPSYLNIAVMRTSSHYIHVVVFFCSHSIGTFRLRDFVVRLSSILCVLPVAFPSSNKIESQMRWILSKNKCQTYCSLFIMTQLEKLIVRSKPSCEHNSRSNYCRCLFLIYSGLYRIFDEISCLSRTSFEYSVNSSDFHKRLN